MTVRAFREERKHRWEELQALVARAGRKPESLGADGVRRLGALYRSTAADLALSRRRYPGDPLLRELELLVGRARNLVYDRPAERRSLVTFATTTYWCLVASRARFLLIAAVLLFGPGALAAGWALTDPAAAAGLVPEAFRSVTEPRPGGADLGLSPGEQAQFSSEIFTNNIRVTFLVFAAGIAFGLGSAVVLVVNGVLLGVVAGLAVESGNGRVFFELVTAHGVLELSCIVVAGAAGLRLGWSLVEPGTLTRFGALQAEAVRSVQIILGTAAWLVLAGLVEGFVTPSGFGLAAVLAVGFGLGAVYWALVALRGVRGTSPGRTT